ncbi:uncharacterized protein [Drosophila takahashii]|uniref:uncharacterized protein n=1 Tax=Drosophila takahashii TaxID=29030 RepID=UPI001CF88028|nr:uncharacterized protein LOC108057180 [Drosophila takahashii]
MRLENYAIRVWSFVAIIWLLRDSHALFKFTNIKCTCYEKSYCELRRCELKLLGRGIVALFLHIQNNQLPINTSVFTLTLFRRLNGYKPFLYNVTVDNCSFMKHKKRYPYFNLVHDAMRNFTNLNHTCPYSHDIIVNRMVLNDNMMAKLPLPTGFYKLKFNWKTGGVWRGVIEVFVEVNLGFD